MFKSSSQQQNTQKFGVQRILIPITVYSVCFRDLLITYFNFLYKYQNFDIQTLGDILAGLIHKNIGMVGWIPSPRISLIHYLIGKRVMEEKMS